MSIVIAGYIDVPVRKRCQPIGTDGCQVEIRMIVSLGTLFQPGRVMRGIAGIALLCLTPCSIDAAPDHAKPEADTDVSWSRYDPTSLMQASLKSPDGKEYRLLVAAPSGPPPPGGYPVIYVVDGNAWTVTISEIIRTNLTFGIESRTVPAVVVGIGYPIPDPFDVNRRAYDLTPRTRFGTDVSAVTGGPSDAALSGGDVRLMDLIDRQVKPLIESRFHINERKQTLVGHSLGGLFVIDTLINRPMSFQTYVALSPSLWWDKQSVFPKVEKFLKSKNNLSGRRIFLSVGAHEQYWTTKYSKIIASVIRGRNVPQQSKNAEHRVLIRQELEATRFYRMVDLSNRLNREILSAGMDSKYVVYAAEDHFSVVPAALGTAIPYALSGSFGH